LTETKEVPVNVTPILQEDNHHLMLSRATNKDIQALLQNVKADTSTMIFEKMDNAFI
jgi:hypothetical protein